MEGASSKNTNNLKVSKKSQKSLFKYFGNSADTDNVNTNHIDATKKNQNTDCVEGIIEVDMHSAQYHSQTNETYDNMPDLEDIVPVGVQPEVQLDITDTNTQQNGRQKSISNSGPRKRKPGDCDIAQNSTQKSKALKTNKNMWTIGRTYKFDWAAKFPFIEPVQSSNSEEIPCECTCTICTWKLGKQQKMQLKLDTIEKHCGKQYLTVTGADGQKIKTHRWKTEKECMHVRYAAEYEAEQKKHRHLLEKGGTITSHIGKMKETNLHAKFIQFSTLFQILKKGRAMSDFLDFKVLYQFNGMLNVPQSHWSESSGWEMAKCLSMIEKEDLKENVKKANFISLSIDEVTAVDNTAWVCIHIYTLENHIRTPHLLGVMKMVENCNAENLYKIVVSHLKDVAGMTDYEIATKLVCVGADGASVM
ncbi:hypothetical protein KI387_043908 [Taxus chinensis]|uniref:DUF4371 domain-containing protein n=2 Tax=Taxus chinensis TaxID=29808 RepID=A0AA38GIM1_TAXCH|nr:hypothetical protein KI387_043908 [Taxus chinensis]